MDAYSTGWLIVSHQYRATIDSNSQKDHAISPSYTVKASNINAKVKT